MNENELTAVCDPEAAAIITDDLAEPESQPCTAIAADEVKPEIPDQNAGDEPQSESKIPFFISAARALFFVVLPTALAVFSLVITIIVASSFFKSFSFDALHIVRLMVGDMVGGAEYAIPVGDNTTSIHPPQSELESDRLSQKSDKATSEEEKTPRPPSLINETPYTPDMLEILSLPRAIKTSGEIYAQYGDYSPVVLIIHTHATEGYSDSEDAGYRTEDENKNVVAIGNIIADKLRACGIATLHCTEYFDTPDFAMAYYNASQAIRKYIQEYPSISYVLDIHRDSIELEDGTSYAPTADTPLGSAAQIMFVVGTDHGGADHSEWVDNLSLAARLHSAVCEDHPDLMRSINLRSASFNEQYTKGSLLIEVGAAASSFDEAKLSAEILSEYLAREIIGQSDSKHNVSGLSE